MSPYTFPLLPCKNKWVSEISGQNVATIKQIYITDFKYNKKLVNLLWWLQNRGLGCFPSVTPSHAFLMRQDWKFNRKASYRSALQRLWPRARRASPPAQRVQSLHGRGGTRLRHAAALLRSHKGTSSFLKHSLSVSWLLGTGDTAGPGLRSHSPGSERLVNKPRARAGGERTEAWSHCLRGSLMGLTATTARSWGVHTSSGERAEGVQCPGSPGPPDRLRLHRGWGSKVLEKRLLVLLQPHGGFQRLWKAC